MKNEKLKLEEIVGYLPYKLKIQYGKWSDYKSERICATSILTVRFLCDLNLDFKPILHPLKEIQNHIHKFSDKLCTYGSNDKFGGIDSASPEDYQLMYKLHLDVYNLIGRGLAIDINTLNK